MFKVNKKTPAGVFIVKFEHISQPFLVFLLLTLIKQMLTGLAFKHASSSHCP